VRRQRPSCLPGGRVSSHGIDAPAAVESKTAGRRGLSCAAPSVVSCDTPALRWHLSFPRRFPFGLWNIALAMCAVGCGSDRTAPTPKPKVVVVDYSAPTHILETLAKGIEDKGGSNGQDAYLGAFAESSAANSGDGRAYHAFFDPRDLLEHPINQDWNKDLERQVYLFLTLRYTIPFEMTWEPYEPAGNETGGPSDSLLHRKYTIAALVGTGSSVTRIPIAVGAADLLFVRSAHQPGRWVIAQWQDWHTVGADSAQVSLGRIRLETQ
jgi:hypothetical protein